MDGTIKNNGFDPIQKMGDRGLEGAIKPSTPLSELGMSRNSSLQSMASSDPEKPEELCCFCQCVKNTLCWIIYLLSCSVINFFPKKEPKNSDDTLSCTIQ